MITDVTGVRAGHWTDEVARTGCTAVLFPPGTVASVEVRGGAPASRELDLLAPERLVDHIDAMMLTGGSAFGLAAADGAMRFCEERGRGFETSAGAVPIVPALSVFDLSVGDPSVRPSQGEGYAACVGASDGPLEAGAVGAGTGATVGKWRGREHARPGGIGSATVRRGELVVSALVVVNAFGDIDVDGSATAPPFESTEVVPGFGGNSTIGVIATNARLPKLQCLLVAQGGHDGLARAIAPVHTQVDGDALVAAATGQLEAPVDIVRMLAVAAVERAVRKVA